MVVVPKYKTLGGLKSHISIFHSSEGQKSEISLTEPKLWSLQGHVLSGVSKGEAVSLTFPAFLDSMASSSIFKASTVTPCFSNHITYFCVKSSSASLIRTLVTAFRVHQDNLLISRALTYSHLQSLFCHRRYFHKPGCLWGHYSAHHISRSQLSCALSLGILLHDLLFLSIRIFCLLYWSLSWKMKN